MSLTITRANFAGLQPRLRQAAGFEYLLATAGDVQDEGCQKVVSASTSTTCSTAKSSTVLKRCAARGKTKAKHIKSDHDYRHDERLPEWHG